MSHHSLRAKHFAGTAPTAGEKISLKNLGLRLVIKNTDTTNPLGVSLDGGRTFFPLGTGVTLDVDTRVHFFWLRGEGGTADYSVIAFVA